ncbi:MAG: ferrous iron transport protein B, partial [Thermovirgaceae bacterium]
MTKKETPIKTVALTGQPNCGKSSVFTMLTGIHQHIANYPGITVDIKKGSMAQRGTPGVVIVDLPGTYSLTSFSEEERAACGFLLEHTPDRIVNVVDASNLQRHLYLTIQLVETGVPVILDLNMTDLAERSSIKIDRALLEKELGVPAAATAAHREKGKEELKAKIVEELPPKVHTGSLVDYGELEEALRLVTDALEASGENLPLAPRWIALKLLEQDEEIWRFCEGLPGTKAARKMAREQVERASQSLGAPPSQHIALKRHEAARDLAARVSVEGKKRERLSDKVDRVVLHPVFGLFVLAGVMFSLYELAIVQGYRLTGYTWPLLGAVRGVISEALPGEGLLADPLLRSSVLYVTDGVLAVLNYIPIFLILFALIAVLEDGGYMPRMSFVLDRLFRRFGLHGQSVLPLVLGGVFVGGCAVPGVMATRGIPDRRARLATIMVVPLMNCLAKVPFYTLLVSIYFASSQSIAMFFIASITLIVALVVSKVLTLTVLKHEPSAPFMMEMPIYHLPALRNVARRSLHRTWMFLRKIFTIVVVASAVVFLLTHYPQPDESAHLGIEARMDEALSDLRDETAGTPYETVFDDERSVLGITRYWQRYRAASMKAGGDRAARDEVGERFRAENPEFFEIVTARTDKDARAAKQALMQFLRTRTELRNERNKLQIRESILGRVGIGL